MKKIAIILAAILGLAACNKPETVVPIADHNTLYAQIEQETSTKTYMDVNNNIRWSEGDRIIGFMKSSLGLKYQILPSSVGKTYASFENISDSNGNINAGTEWDHNVVYYPYSDVVEAQKLGSNYSLSVSLPAEQTYAEDSFGNGSMAMVAVNETNNITFKNVLGGMKIQLKGSQTVKSIKVEGKNNEKLSGTAAVTAYADNLAPAITMTATDEASKSVTLTCGDGIQLSESTATEFIIALPPVLFSKGFVITVTDSNSQTYTIETDKVNTVLRSSILTMPAFTLGQTPGDEEDGTDSPIKVLDIAFDKSTLTLAPSTSYTLVTIVVPEAAEDKTLTWSSNAPTVATVDQSGVVTAVSDGTASITAVAAGGASKSCTVNVISVPTSVATADYVDEYGINHGKGVAIGGTVWAPVNCGYKAAVTDADGNVTDNGFPYGKLYQWGRKYGQGYSADSDSEPMTFPGPVSAVVGQDASMAGYFFVGSSDWVETRDDSMWNSGTEDAPVKTVNDPCPSGWRVPTYGELYALLTDRSEWTSKDNQSGYYFSGVSATVYDTVPLIEDKVQVFFPAAGGRNDSFGDARNRGNYGCYWSSRPHSNFAYYLYFDYGYAYMSGDVRASVYSVRCVQE